MVSLGYDLEDIEASELHHFLFFGDVEVRRLTRRVWRDIKSSIENLILKAKEIRWIEARRTLLDTRGQVIRSAYLAHQKTMEPTTWSTLPYYEELLSYEAFSELLNDPSEMELTPSACNEALNKLSDYLAHWRQQRMKHLLAQLHGETTDLVDAASNEL
ncbi:hypothetical protein C0991_006290, partial [Blastosporella zonata]